MYSELEETEQCDEERNSNAKWTKVSYSLNHRSWRSLDQTLAKHKILLLSLWRLTSLLQCRSYLENRAFLNRSSSLFWAARPNEHSLRAAWPCLGASTTSSTSRCAYPLDKGWDYGSRK